MTEEQIEAARWSGLSPSEVAVLGRAALSIIVSLVAQCGSGGVEVRDA